MNAIVDVFSVVAQYCFPATLWNLRQCSRGMSDAVDRATETLWIPVVFADPSYPEVFVGAYGFRLNAVLIFERLPSTSRIRMGKGATREFTKEDSASMAEAVLRAWQRFSWAIVEAEDDAVGDGWSGCDVLGRPVKLLPTKLQREAKVGTMSTNFFANLGVVAPFVVAATQRSCYDLAEALRVGLGKSTPVYHHEIELSGGVHVADYERYKAGTSLLPSTLSAAPGQLHQLKEDYPALHPFIVAHIQRKIHTYLQRDMLGMRGAAPFRGRPPPGYETAASAKDVQDRFTILPLTRACGIVGQPVWWRGNELPPWASGVTPPSHGSLEEAFAACAGNIAPLRVPKVVVDDHAVSSGFGTQAALAQRLKRSLFVIARSRAPFHGEKPPAQLQDYYTAKAIERDVVRRLLVFGSSAARDPPPPDELEKVLLKVGVDFCGRDVLVTARDFVEYCETAPSPYSSESATKVAYVADNRYLGSFYSDELYNPTTFHHRHLRPLFDTAAMEGLLQDGQPLDAPWILLGTWGTTSSPHQEPHGSSVVVHNFVGKKQWFVRVPATFCDGAAQFAREEDPEPRKLSEFLDTCAPSGLMIDSSRNAGEWVWVTFVQEEGETVCMPPGVLHCTRNDSSLVLSVAINFKVRDIGE